MTLDDVLFFGWPFVVFAMVMAVAWTTNRIDRRAAAPRDRPHEGQ